MLAYLETLSHKFDIIGLSETWLKESEADLYDIPGYNHVAIESMLNEVVSHYMWEIYSTTKSEKVFLFIMSTVNACLLRLLILHLYWLQLYTDVLVQTLKHSLNSLVIN